MSSRGASSRKPLSKSLRNPTSEHISWSLHCLKLKELMRNPALAQALDTIGTAPNISKRRGPSAGCPIPRPRPQRSKVRWWSSAWNHLSTCWQGIEIVECQTVQDHPRLIMPEWADKGRDFWGLAKARRHVPSTLANNYTKAQKKNLSTKRHAAGGGLVTTRRFWDYKTVKTTAAQYKMKCNVQACTKCKSTNSKCEIVRLIWWLSSLLDELTEKLMCVTPSIL